MPLLNCGGSAFTAAFCVSSSSADIVLLSAFGSVCEDSGLSDVVCCFCEVIDFSSELDDETFLLVGISSFLFFAEHDTINTTIAKTAIKARVFVIFNFLLLIK